MNQVTIIVGAQWGDEGKGKWVDILSRRMDWVGRYQGGNNAGHTLYINGQKTVLHQIPSGIFTESLRCVLTAGVVINPEQLISEMEKIRGKAAISPGRLLVSARSHVITPWHVYLDGMREQASGGKIGTTKRGIGPTYESKAARTGLRVGHYIDATARGEWVKSMSENADFKTHFSQNNAAWQSFFAAAEILSPFVCDAESHLRQALSAGKKILFEGAQGTLLDLDHGTYPYVTSSSTAAAGALASVGFSAKYVGEILGVSKAYATRVGGGPFPTELNDDVGEFLRSEGQEFGATTGRPRRCGWLDAVALRYAVATNGMTGVILNKLDVLSKLPTIRVAIAYEHPKQGRLTEFPWDPAVLADCRPIYEDFSGWQSEIPKSGAIADLPKAARVYVAAVEKMIDTAIPMVGTGVERCDGLYSAEYSAANR